MTLPLCGFNDCAARNDFSHFVINAAGEIILSSIFTS
jgi:hypothetical protein